MLWSKANWDHHGISSARDETVFSASLGRSELARHSLMSCVNRCRRGLHASWEEGIPASCVSNFLERHVGGGGILVGWEIHHDLDVLGFQKASFHFCILPHGGLIKRGH